MGVRGRPLEKCLESGVKLGAQLTSICSRRFSAQGAPCTTRLSSFKRVVSQQLACFLPLSMNPTSTGQFGTRYRVALGVTEETDAFAVIVSEGTGELAYPSGAKSKGI